MLLLSTDNSFQKLLLATNSSKIQKRATRHYFKSQLHKRAQDPCMKMSSSKGESTDGTKAIVHVLPTQDELLSEAK